MTHVEDRSTTPQKDTYRAPSVTEVGKVEELTAGGPDGSAFDGMNGWRGLAVTGDETDERTDPDEAPPIREEEKEEE